MSKVGEAYFDIVGREGPLIGALERSDRAAASTAASITQELDAIGDRMTALGTRWSVAVTAPITGLGYYFSRAASDAEEVHSKFDQVFKAEAASTRAWAEEQATALRRNATDLEAYLAQFQDIFVPMGFARDEAAELSRQMTQLTIDLASFNNVAEPEVARSLSGALVGNHENARRFGVVITENTLLQKAFQMGLAASREELTEQEKVLARLQILLEGTEDAQGDASRTAYQHANTMRALGAATDRVAEAWGDRLNPQIDHFVNDLAIPMANSLAEVDDLTKDITISATGMAAAVGPGLLAIGGAANLLKWSLSGLGFLVTLPGAIAASVAAFGGLEIVTQAINRNTREIERNLKDVDEELVQIGTQRGPEWQEQAYEHLIRARRAEIEELERAVTHPAGQLWLETQRTNRFAIHELEGMLDQALKFRPGLKQQLDGVLEIAKNEELILRWEGERDRITGEMAQKQELAAEDALRAVADQINAQIHAHAELDHTLTREMLDRYDRERAEIEDKFQERKTQIEQEGAVWERLLSWREQKLREIDEKETEDIGRRIERERREEEAKEREAASLVDRRRSLVEELHAQSLETTEGELAATLYRINVERDARIRLITELFSDEEQKQRMIEEAWDTAHRKRFKALKDETEELEKQHKIRWTEVPPERFHQLLQREIFERAMHPRFQDLERLTAWAEEAENEPPTRWLEVPAERLSQLLQRERFEEINESGQGGQVSLTGGSAGGQTEATSLLRQILYTLEERLGVWT